MKYPFNVFQTKVEGHTFWVAECPTLKGCVGQGDTTDEALAELKTNVDEWLAVAEECGLPIPEVPFEQINDYSGKFTVRVAPYVHKKAVEMAKKQGVSLNQYVNDSIVAQNSMLTTIFYVEPEIKSMVNDFKSMICNSTKTISDGYSYMTLARSAKSNSVYSMTN